MSEPERANWWTLSEDDAYRLDLQMERINANSGKLMDKYAELIAENERLKKELAQMTAQRDQVVKHARRIAARNEAMRARKTGAQRRF